jgi:hypothetical protein
MVGLNVFREREDGVKEKLYEMGLLWRNRNICEKELSSIQNCDVAMFVVSKL